LFQENYPVEDSNEIQLQIVFSQKRTLYIFLTLNRLKYIE
jgi:hypothetical protein